MGSYKKIILLVFMILPLFTGSMAVVGLQTAYGTVVPFCGDGVKDTGEQCDEGGANGTSCGCNDSCQFPVLGTLCEGDGDLCTIDACDGAGACVTLSTTTCPDGDDVCDGVASCDPATGQCIPDPAPLSTPCELDNDLCTIDHCDGAGSCVLLSTTTCQAGDGICEAGESCNPATGACEDLADPSSGTVCSCSVGAGECDGTGICIGIVSIDVKPGSDPNSINPKSMGVVPVAILGSDTLDVLDVDYANVEFGTGGAMPVHVALEDVNDDGFIDLVLHFVQKETGIAKGNVEACISGDIGGQPFSGCDAIKTPGK